MLETKFVFKCDTPCKKADTEECTQLECIYGQMSIVHQLMEIKRENSLLKLSASDKYELLHKYYAALISIKAIAETHDSIPCDIYDADCSKCHDKITNDGQTCMKKGWQIY